MSVGAVTAADLISAFSAYATRLHATAGKEHHVASPLGAWMLLALCATGAEGRLRDELTAILGVDVDTAAGFVASLLADPHPGVALGSGIWTSSGIRAEAGAHWLARLPAGVYRATLPSQAALDAWARERTRGMILRFAVQRSAEDMLILATALATDVRWRTPFDPVAAAQRGLTGATMWSGAVQRVMKAPESKHHRALIAMTKQAGDVAVHVADAEQAMSVTSVIAAPDVPPPDVIATAYEIASGRRVDRRSLFDLPIGNAPMWRITEQPTDTAAPDGREERHEAVLPTWRAEGSHDLRRAELGFPVVAEALAPIVGVADYEYGATQAVVARYGVEGFTATALSVLRARGRRAAYPRPRPGVLRTATLRFGHPYAVVAVATRSGPWHGVPVYSAWVAEPTEADEV